MPVKIVPSYYTKQVIIWIYLGEKKSCILLISINFLYLYAPTYADTYKYI